jgi:ankyrin repeat protein
MNMKRIPVCFLFVVALALTGCGQATPIPLPTQTVTPIPSPTQTAIPLSVEEALIKATKKNDMAGVIAALEQGADIETREPLLRMTPLIIASTHGYTEIAMHLMEKGADVNATGKQGINPLIAAAMNGHADMVALLAAQNINVDQLSGLQYKENALHLAARNGYTEVIEELLKAGADVNALEGTNSTALMYAAYNGHLETVELLLKEGAELNVRDEGGYTALYWANRQNHTDIAALISAAGGTE